MHLSLSLTLPFIDADRHRMNAPRNGGKPTDARVWFTVAFVALGAVWLFLRVNGYFLR